MHIYFQIVKQEVFTLFISTTTYISSFYFLSLLGISYRFFLEFFSSTNWILPPLTSLLIGLLFGSPGLVPFLTMRTFSEERKLGTLEVLMSAPVSSTELVLGKWTASLMFLYVIFGLSFCFPLITYLIYPSTGISLGFNEPSQWIGIFSFLVFHGCTFTAFGIFASSLTKNQMISGMLTFSLISIYLTAIIFTFGESFPISENQGIFDYLESTILSLCSGLSQMHNFSLGLLDVKTIFHQITLTVLFLFLAIIQVDRIKHKA
jgi:ABC-2 type transport system permease protein